MTDEINFCKGFADKVADKQGFENKVRYLLEDFFFEEGWANKNNKKVMKEGYSQQYSYNYSTIRHFIEDFVRLSKLEFGKAQEKIELPKKRWLEFNDFSNPKKKTKNIEVLNKETRDTLGEIKWKGSWRQYVLAEGCLYELFEKIRKLRLERRK